ncbi:MAG: TonB-dependent receptor [Bryobacteraceae bacterium]
MRFLGLSRIAALFSVSLLAQPPERRDSVIVTGAYQPIATEESDRPVRSTPVRDDLPLAGSAVDFLNRDSSVDLRQRGQNNIQTDLSIRGSTFGQTLVLLDGMRLNDVQSGHHNLDIPVPLETLDRIEVLKGAGSTLYGSDAVGGVVHLITKPPEHSELRLRGAFGSFGTNQQRVAAAYARGDFSQQLTASRDFSTGFIPNRDYRNLALTSLTRWKRTDIVLATADKPFGAEQFYGNFNSWERTRTWFASVRQGIGERTQAGFAFRRHTDLFVLYRDRPQVFTNRHAAESWQANFRRWESLPANARLHWGVEALGDEIASNNLGHHRRARGSAYAAYDIRALRRFSLSLGAREEIYRSFDKQFTPSIAGGAWINEHLKLRANASRAFRLPTYTDLYYQDPANRGTPNLRPERAWNYEGGLDWHASSRVRGEITVFQRRERDGIDYVRATPADIWRATNFQQLHFTGLEAGLTLRPREGHIVELGYTGLHGVQNALSGLQSKYAFNYPTHQGLVTWRSALPGGLAARARIGAVQRFARDPYAVADLYLARTRGPVHPFVQVTNLTDRIYEEIFGVRMPGRAALVGLEWVWR